MLPGRRRNATSTGILRPGRCTKMWVCMARSIQTKPGHTLHLDVLQAAPGRRRHSRLG